MQVQYYCKFKANLAKRLIGSSMLIAYLSSRDKSKSSKNKSKHQIKRFNTSAPEDMPINT